jgi:hypothetical protein
MILTRLHHFNRRQKGSQPSDGGRLARAAIAKHHNPTNARICGCDQHGQLHVILADNGCERESDTH